MTEFMLKTIASMYLMVNYNILASLLIFNI